MMTPVSPSPPRLLESLRRWRFWLGARPKRVLMVTSALARGGCERQLLATAAGLVRLGHHVEILELTRVTDDELSFRDELSQLGLTCRHAAELLEAEPPESTDADVYDLQRFGPLVHELSIGGLATALGRAIETFRPDVVHCWSEPATVIGGLVATQLGVPRIVLGQRNVTASRRNSPHAELYRDAYRQILGGDKVVVANNSATNRDDYEQWLEVPPGTIRVVYNGFLPGSVRIRRGEEAREIRRALGLPDDARAVGAVMRLAPEKDPDLWLDTAAILARARQEIHFVVAGYGELAEQTARRARELGLTDRFTLTGPAADVGSIYAALDVFLMTSCFEGTPNTLIEAQAAGVPVVAPLVGGTGETAVHGTTGLLVHERTAESLAAAVLQILDDPSWPRRCAVRGPAFVSRRFGHRRMIRQTLALYEDSRASAGQRLRQLLGRLTSARHDGDAGTARRP
jgi:glycosyltransferase involved in cell wall biosynthesis